MYVQVRSRHYLGTRRSFLCSNLSLLCSHIDTRAHRPTNPLAHPRRFPQRLTHFYKNMPLQSHRCQRPSTCMQRRRDTPSHPCARAVGDTDGEHPSTCRHKQGLEHNTPTQASSRRLTLKIHTRRCKRLPICSCGRSHSDRHPEGPPKGLPEAQPQNSHPDTPHTQARSGRHTRAAHTHSRTGQTHLGPSYL